MSKYTTEVRFICESYCSLNESGEYGKIDDIIDASMDKIFDFEYPIFDSDYKRVLQRKILKHYYTREIGAESVGLWKHWLNTRLNEIMPYYNKMYESDRLEFNPLFDTDITRTHSGSGTNIGDSNSNVESLDKYSDTPQGGVKNLINETYLTNATLVTNKGSNKTNVNTTDEYVEKVTGKQGTGTYANMIKEYRQTLINVDMLVIDELKDLFLNLW